jgi:hypothetical protein
MRPFALKSPGAVSEWTDFGLPSTASWAGDPPPCPSFYQPSQLTGPRESTASLAEPLRHWPLSPLGGARCSACCPPTRRTPL